MNCINSNKQTNKSVSGKFILEISTKTTVEKHLSLNLILNISLENALKICKILKFPLTL